MSELFRYDFKIQLDFEQYKEVFGDNYGHTTTDYTRVYNSSLWFNQIKPQYSKLTIYYDHQEYIFEKLEYLLEKGINILSLIKPEPTEDKWNFRSILDLSESMLIKIKESHYYLHDKQPVVLTIDNISILDPGGFMYNGRFTLTENAIQHISNYIKYTFVAYIEDKDPLLYENNNRTVRLGPVAFKLMFEHQYEAIHGREITIIRDPYLVFTEESDEVSAEEFILLGTKVCQLMSLFWEKRIDFFHAKVRIKPHEKYRTKELIKYSEPTSDKSVDSYLERKLETFYNFIERIDYDAFCAHELLVADTTTRLIRSKEVDSISRFMIYYNIIEKIRNYCMATPIKDNQLTIKEEYSFTVGKRKRDNIIKDAIKSISSIVEDSDVKDFEANASNKVTFIRKTGLIDQFSSLISFLGLDAEDYAIDFQTLIRIRNDIYHGNLPDENIPEYNHHMNSLIYDMLLKLITY
ncbi:hypothetical protein [Hymenobacter jeollabukensis]|uniref:ApeA N-terminal domain-containing protein n=1 Tax=Hymenobacter jeollabukensis TaxID=2025313 RepID=A0A5R8WK01_9BACT|nr:hypothetical protein [Hymenobacter jeollabukensis]TLM88802.1 hypothetical protein FDY95_23495 [Hymenobacter jeollabukensis]